MIARRLALPLLCTGVVACNVQPEVEANGELLRGEYLACRKEKTSMDKVVKFRTWVLEEICKDPSTQGRREEPVTLRPRIAQAL